MSEKNKAAAKGRFSVIFPYLRQYRAYLVFGGVAVILANGLLLVNPYILKLIFDVLQNQGPAPELTFYVLLMVGLALVAGVFRFLMRRTIIWMSRKLEYDLRGELARHLLKLSPAYYDTTRTGDIMARATNDLEAVRMMIGPGIMQMSNTIVTIAVSLTMMIYLSPKLTLYAMIPSVLFPFVVHRLGSLVHKRFIKIQEQFSLLTAVAQENLAGARVVRAYRQEDEEIDHFAKISSDYAGHNVAMGRLYGAFFPLITFIATGLTLVVFYFGGMDVINGKLPLGTIVAFFSYLGYLFWPMMAIGWVISLYQRGTASLDRINDILKTEPIIQTAAENPYAGDMRGRVEFRNLRFTYDTRPVLNGISLVIDPGQTIGLVGMTGSGKTTLVSLIARQYPVERGMIFVDDVDINDWDLNALRRQIGFVTQEAFLFSDTMTNNIRFGRFDAPPAEVADVATAAALAKDIATFPASFDTIVGERGITLSGGQKQRTAIARALLIDPAIVVLDDATSAVDTETEDEINNRIHGRIKKCTTFIISHRMSSVKEADVILYLEDGCIVEQGNHEHLMREGGRYAELYQSQLLEQEIEKL